MRSFRIGLMLGTKDTDYPRSIRLGVQNVIEEAGHVLVNIADLIPYHTHDHCEEYLRVAFELASRLDLDATIVPAGVVNGYLDGNEELAREIISVMDPAKTVVLERELPGFRCIMKDGVPGMRACMRHLIEDHGFRRIAFISGPETSVGAREREGVYFEEMAAHGLPVPEGFFVRGQFSGECRDEVERVVALQPEAIVCAVDLIAFTTYHVMHEQGLTVGEDIAVTGFDDHPNSAHMDPPLSTVHLTAYDYGRMAAREAIRLCEGRAQEERVLSSSFVVRGSCGEQRTENLDYWRSLLVRRPLPVEEIADELVAATLFMAGPQMEREFRASVVAFVQTAWQGYQDHRAHPGEDDVLFSSNDLADLFSSDYRGNLSLEGFHAVCINLLETLLAVSPEQDRPWVIDQISYLHLRVARMLNESVRDDTFTIDQREWQTFRLAEHALTEDASAQEVYRSMLEELGLLGVRQAGLFLLPEPVLASGGKSLALSDELRLVGTLDNGRASIPEEPVPVALQGLVSRMPASYLASQLCTFGCIMAGDELMGLLVMSPGSLTDNRQLMVLLNMGHALKHLQMLQTAHEMNEVLSAEGLLLARQSRHDEMTGLLNRRGLADGVQQALTERPDALGALIYLDLDGLKHINDSMGHDVGDAAIRAMSVVLSGNLGSNCLIARMGGDEFVVFSLVADEAEAEGIVATIEQGVAQVNASSGLPFELGVSCGLACFAVSGKDSAPSVASQALALADERMYQAKRRHHAQERNTVPGTSVPPSS